MNPCRTAMASSHEISNWRQMLTSLASSTKWLKYTGLLNLCKRRTGAMYSIQKHHESAVHADLLLATLGGRCPNAPGIVDPDTAVAALMASQISPLKSYEPIPSSKPLNWPVHRSVRTVSTFSKTRCMKSCGKLHTNEMDDREDNIEVPLIPYCLATLLEAVTLGWNWACWACRRISSSVRSGRLVVKRLCVRKLEMQLRRWHWSHPHPTLHTQTLKFVRDSDAIEADRNTRTKLSEYTIHTYSSSTRQVSRSL